MKTQTSKKSFWLKSLLILPLFSLLLFSFSTKIEVEKETSLFETTTEQEGATKKQLNEYNKLARKYNAQDGNRIIIKKKDVERLNYLYSLMTDAQKRVAEPYPNFPPPPPSPKIIKEINSTNTNIPPPPPPAPKFIEEVNPNIPPPPPPPTLNMEDLAKQGATFYYDGNKIPNKKAIQLYKSNKKLNIQISQVDSKNPIVKLSNKPIKVEKKELPAKKNIQSRSLKMSDPKAELKKLSEEGARFLLFDGGPHFKNGEEVTLENALKIIEKIKGITINIKEGYLYKIVELRAPGC